MERADIRSFDLNSIASLLSEFSDQGIVFQSEAQFQFKLAWRINELFDCDVLLEGFLSGVKKEENTFKHKFYTDIVLSKDDYRIAIELKYKTAELNIHHLFNHGASDLGRYDYLKDVHRLELLVGSTSDPNITILEKCNKGYSVILTNDHAYWDYISFDEERAPIYREFHFGQSTPHNDDGQLFGSTLDWKRDTNGNYTKTIEGTSRAYPLILSKRYTYSWKDYLTIDCSEKNSIFRYMIIGV